MHTFFLFFGFCFVWIGTVSPLTVDCVPFVFFIRFNRIEIRFYTFGNISDLRRFVGLVGLIFMRIFMLFGLFFFYIFCFLLLNEVFNEHTKYPICPFACLCLTHFSTLNIYSFSVLFFFRSENPLFLLLHEFVSFIVSFSSHFCVCFFFSISFVYCFIGYLLLPCFCVWSALWKFIWTVGGLIDLLSFVHCESKWN